MKKNVIKSKTNSFFLIAAVAFFVFLFSGIFKQCKIQHRFGFMVSTPYIGPRIKGCEVIMVITSDEGGAFHKAGIRSGDVLLDTSYNWVQDYLGSFDLPPGTEFEVNTIPKGFKANNCQELSELPMVARTVIAP